MNEMSPKTDVIVKLTGEDGNVFHLCSIVVKALKRNGYRDEAKEVAEALWGQHSYSEALELFTQYVFVE